MPITVNSPNVAITETAIESTYSYQSTTVSNGPNGYTVTPVQKTIQFRTETTLPKLGAMLVGLGGNNGTTCVAGALANKHRIQWKTKEGVKTPNFFGSITQASTVGLGSNEIGEDVYCPMKDLLPMVDPTEIVWGGWDISKMNLADAMERAQVLDWDLQRQLAPMMQNIVPLPAIFDPDFIAANQSSRADNVIPGTRQEKVDTVRKNIRDFKEQNSLDKVIVLWTANTERYAQIIPGLNDTADNLLQAIKRDESEISPSTLFCVACLLEGVTFINGSPQNTFVPGAIELAIREKVFIGGDDFKSGQTKFKSVLTDFLINAGMKPRSIVSYNHLGNNDGKNLSAPQTFRSKEISKSGVVEDMVLSNQVLYPNGLEDKPDHCIVIKYIPYVADSKRAMDEYTSEIFMGGHNTIVVHNTCEDSLLATPIIYDLVILAELFQRITFRPVNVGAAGEKADYQSFHSVLSLLSYLLKAPLVPEGTPVVNALFKQRAAIDNLMKACVGLPAESNMRLENYAPSIRGEVVARCTATTPTLSSPKSTQGRNESYRVTLS